MQSLLSIRLIVVVLIAFPAQVLLRSKVSSPMLASLSPCLASPLHTVHTDTLLQGVQGHSGLQDTLTKLFP